MVLSTRNMIAAALAMAATASADNNKIETAIQNQPSSDIIIEFVGGNSAALERVQIEGIEDRGAAIAQLRDVLVEESTKAQLDLIGLFEAEGIDSNYFQLKQFWINNVVSAKRVPLQLVQEIAKLPNVKQIRRAKVAKRPFLKSVNAPLVHRRLDDDDAKVDAPGYRQLGDVDAVEWGVQKISAPSVWANGYKGKGVVVSNIDGGVHYTHEALKSNWRESYGWYDPYHFSDKPNDEDGHGTHTMGTMVGTTGTGVAPEAQWVACKGCDGEDCTEEALLGCAQFILCPTDTKGKNKDCSKAPHVVNNSWGSDQNGDMWYFEVVSAWRKAGIIPVFANGNAGPSCGTVGSPGDYGNVIGVGATAADDSLAYFSSRGPTPKKTIKPDVSAPGYKIRSSGNLNDKDYQIMSGTSMATPHVVGAIALIKSANPKATYDDIYQMLTANVDTDTLKVEKINCGNVSNAVYPNNNYGFGRINMIKTLPY